MISNAVKKMALPRNNKLKKTAGENINSKSSFPREAYASVSGSAISGGTTSQDGVEQISNISRFGRLP
jgi:hypothetical protein